MKYQVIHEFNGRDGEIPFGVLFQGADGALYGTTNCGGFYDRGVVYKLNLDGSGFRVLHNFSRVLGSYPESGVIQGAGGVLYGTTTQGGSYNRGVVYALNPDGSDFRVLHSFAGGKDGGYPEACVIQAADGALYGTTRLGGAYGRGTVFRLNTDGSGFQILHSFEGDEGAYPLHGVMQGSDGALYGTTRSGGHYEIGVVFKMNLDGSGFFVLHSFAIEQGAHPWPSVIEASDGTLYGTAKLGGGCGHGVIFKINPDGSGFGVLRHLEGTGEEGTGEDGAYPCAGLIQGPDGALYGTATEGGAHDRGCIFKINPDGSGYQILHSFAEGGEDGAYPEAGVILGSDGALYGTTKHGGASGHGVVFKINPF